MDFKSAFVFAAAVALVAAPALADAPSATPAAASTTAPAAAGTAVPAAVTAALSPRYNLTCTAVLSGADKDLQAAFAVMAPEFVQTDLQGKTQKRDEVVANAEQQMKMFHGTACNETIDSATQPDANTIVATVTQKIEGQIQAPDANHDLSATDKTQDTWKLQNGTWMETASKDLRTLVKLDGKVVQDDGQ